MKITAALLALIQTLNLSVTQPPQDTIVIDGSSYTLVFEDDFNGSELDSSKWERCPEWHRQDLNNYWDDDMSWLDGEGNLIIGMEYDSVTDRYNSGAIRSKGIFEQQYGYFEIRCTVNNIPGYWTAFWLMSDSVNSELNGGVDGTEIDIYESAYFKDGLIQHTLNWDGYGAAHKSEGVKVPADVYDGRYHTFSLLWTEQEYVCYIDGRETWRTDAAAAGGTSAVPAYMKISSEMGGWTFWGGDGIVNPRKLPDYIKVDYVRVYAEK